MIDAVRLAVRSDLSVSVESPASVTMELTEKEDHSALLVHLVNFNDKETVSNIHINLRIPGKRKIKDLAIISPDSIPQQRIPFLPKGKNMISFTVGQLQTYDVIVARLE